MINLHLALSVPVTNYPLTIPLKRRVFSGDILAEIALRHGLDVRDLKGPCRDRRLAWPRQEACYEIRRRTRFSLPQIGDVLGGRDHTTILHGIRAHCHRNELPVPRRGECVA